MKRNLFYKALIYEKVYLQFIYLLSEKKFVKIKIKILFKD